MGRKLLSSAALVAASILTVPASAQSWASAGISSGSAFAGSSSAAAYSGESSHSIGVAGKDGHRGDRRHSRRGRGFESSVAFGDWDRDYQGDILWRPNSFNDWWHERPNRSFPRWMQNNQNCERQWWGGGVWRC